MAAKGAIVKEQLLTFMQDFLQTHSAVEGVFCPDGKELRVDTIENGVPVQIKISLTAVKSPIIRGSENEVINEEQFFISEEEAKDLSITLEELGVKF